MTGQKIRIRTISAGITKVVFLCPGTPGLKRKNRNADHYFLAGFEHGPTHLICADSYEDAWEEWIDNLPDIGKEDLYMAYGFHDHATFEFVSGLPEEDQPQWLRDYGISENGEWDLAEGYYYMPNSSGCETGIVYVGEYGWLGLFPFWDAKGNKVLEYVGVE